jgi:hypothetical protein
MMADIARLHAPAALANYDEWDEAMLRKELANCLRLTAENLVRAATIWAALERKGCDLSGIKDGFTLYLPHIAAGTVLAELVVAFAGRPTLLKKLARLTPADQQRMVDGEPLPFVVRPGELRMLPVRTMSTRQILQVMGEGTIRTEREQIALLCEPQPIRKPGRPASVGKVRVDKAAGLVHIGKSFAPYTDVVSALRMAGLVE